MKHDFCSIGKHTVGFLLGAVMLCLCSGCTSSDEETNYENIGNVIGNPKEDESVNKDQLLETSNSQPQTSPDVSSEKEWFPTYENNEEEQAPSNENSEKEQASADIKINEHQVSTDKNIGKSNNVSNEQVGQNSMFSIEECYKTILLDKGTFICTDLGNKELILSDIGEAVTDDESVAVKATKFTVIDLDGDGEDEVVLWIQLNGITDYGFEILHFQEGAVYGYTLPYRTFFNLKSDGTFSFSGNAADSGIGKLRFSVDGYAIENIMNEAYPEETSAVMNQQEAKTDVTWYDLSVDGVNRAFK